MEQGKTILHYKIIDKLGEGGMGVVYKAKDTKLDRTVALKFLPPHLTKSKKDRKRFIREAKSAAALNHPNICTIHAVEEHEGKDFISMEYIDGQTLREKLESEEMTFDKALEYAVQIAGALGKAHDKGVIHRDIKPGNIMINAENQIKVMDFGLAKMADSTPITKTGATVGTMAYMAPEQIEGKQIDHRADLFSFGVVLFEMLTGERPFQGQYDAALSYAIVNEEPNPIQDYLPKAPQKLIEFFDRILAKDPDERIESAATARNLLEDIKESLGSNLQRTQETVAAATSTNQETDSGSTTISITLPNIVFGNTSIDRTGFIAATLGVLAIILLAGWWFVGNNSIEDNTEVLTTGSETEITDRSIAVLPFNNLSGTDEITSITRGIHDDLLTRLSNIGDLRVTSRTSVAHYRDTDLALPVIADSLGVRWIMVGGVQQGGDQIQVNAQLIDPQTDANIWADSYRRELTAENIFAIQEDITGEIAQALQAEISEGEQERIARAPTRNLSAYQLYVQGRNRLDQATSLDDIEQAGNLFIQAIEIDSTFALAWSGLSDAMAGQSYHPDTLHYQNINHEEAARKSLELDPNLSEAHSSMGIIHVIKNHNGPAALKAFQKAVELKPSNAQAHNRLGRTYYVLGRPEEGMRHLQLAEELNPQHWHARHALYDAYIVEGQYDKALREVTEQEKMAPGWLGYNYAKFRTLYLLGKYRKAKETGLKADSLLVQRRDSIDYDYAPMMQTYIAEAETALGDTASAKQRIERIISDNNFRRRIDLIYAYCALGDTEAAIREFKK